MSIKSPMSVHGYEPVSPVDVTSNGQRKSRNVGFTTIDIDEKQPSGTTRSVRTNSSSSSTPSLNTARKARFAEATTVESPGAGVEKKLPFSQKSKLGSDAKPSDVGFGYISDSNPVEQHATLHPTSNGLASPPLKSALKTPGTATRFLNPLSPTFQEEQVLEKQEASTEVQQAKDLKVKTRVRMAKMVLRGVNFSCSLIVLSMLSTTFSIFNATRAIPSRNNLPVWAQGTQTWPQITVLVISCVSLAMSLVVMFMYWRGGHRRAAKAAVYYTMFAVGYFIFSTVMWLVAAGVLHGSKAGGNGQDMWGWACKDNKRRQLFQNEVNYALVCRLQNWGLVCAIIEVVVEVITISIYGVVFYRFYSKEKLRKSMDQRDRARSDLYLAQLRSQSAPNTPGFAQTPRSPGFPSMYKGDATDPWNAAEHGKAQFVEASPQSATSPSSTFKLQPPPIRIHNATPKTPQDGFAAPSPPRTVASPPPQLPQERIVEHVAAAPGEQTYDAVPIPGAYAGAIKSPGFAPHAY